MIAALNAKQMGSIMDWFKDSNPPLDVAPEFSPVPIPLYNGHFNPYSKDRIKSESGGSQDDNLIHISDRNILFKANKM